MPETIEEVIRFGVPGYAFLIPVVILSILFFPNALSNDTVGLIFFGVGLFVGYILQQLWMYNFENKEGYDWTERPCIKHILSKHEDWKKYTKNGKNWKAYVEWEKRFYEEEKEGIRYHDRRAWHYYHSLMTTSISCAIGSLIFLVVVYYAQNRILAVFSVIGAFLYFESALVLYLQGKQSNKLLMNFEKELAEK